MTFEYLLHGDAAGAAGTSVLFGLPMLAAAAAAVLTAALVWLAGWRAGFAAAVLGAVLLGAGMIGDMVSHQGHDRDRHEILTTLMETPNAGSAHQLMELESVEARNEWHLVSAAGQGFLVSGLTAAALILWRRSRTAAGQVEGASEPLRRAA